MILAVDVPREVFQSTHPARGATERGRALSVAVGISIHAPREGCDPRMVRSASQLSLFQSTHPARGATPSTRTVSTELLISIHAPREGCDCNEHLRQRAAGYISIHAPREGCDIEPAQLFRILLEFQSTHPARGATKAFVSVKDGLIISIHAPREGCDRGRPS